MGSVAFRRHFFIFFWWLTIIKVTTSDHTPARTSILKIYKSTILSREVSEVPFAALLKNRISECTDFEVTLQHWLRCRWFWPIWLAPFGLLWQTVAPWRKRRFSLWAVWEKASQPLALPSSPTLRWWWLSVPSVASSWQPWGQYATESLQI